MKRKLKLEEDKRKPVRHVQLITFGEYEAMREAAVKKISGDAWSPARENELNLRLQTVDSLVHDRPGVFIAPTPASQLSREATGAVLLLKKWIAKITS